MAIIILWVHSFLLWPVSLFLIMLEVQSEEAIVLSNITENENGLCLNNAIANKWNFSLNAFEKYLVGP